MAGVQMEESGAEDKGDEEGTMESDTNILLPGNSNEENFTKPKTFGTFFKLLGTLLPEGWDQLPLTGETSNKLVSLASSMTHTTLALLPSPPTGRLDSSIVLPRPTLHLASILLTMLLAAVTFSAQLCDVISNPGTGQTTFARLSDPENTYASRWSSTVFLNLEGSKLILLVSGPVTFLLCLPLLLLTRRSSMLHLLLASLLTPAMAALHSFLAVLFFSWLLLLDPSSISISSLALRITVTLTQPAMASILTALALSYLNSLAHQGTKSEEPASKCRMASTTLVTLGALVTLVLVTVVLTTTSMGLMTSLSGHWNSTESSSYMSDCPDSYHDHQYRDYYWEGDRVTRPPPTSWPDHCYGVSLDYRTEASYMMFTISHLCLSFSLLVTSLLVILAGPTIIPTILLCFGIVIFSSAIASTIFYFTSLIEYVDADILTSCEIILGGVVGLGLCIVSCGAFINALTVLVKIVLFVIHLLGLLLLSLVAGVVFLAKISVTSATSPEKKVMRIESEA